MTCEDGSREGRCAGADSAVVVGRLGACGCVWYGDSMILAERIFSQSAPGEVSRTYFRMQGTCVQTVYAPQADSAVSTEYRW